MIPGFIISIITFPGVIAHEFAHSLFCRLTGTAVRSVCYFRLGNPAGYVIHDTPDSTWKQIIIGSGPFVVNTGIGLALGIIAYFSKELGAMQHVIEWLGISIAMHSFPSSTDAKVIWKSIWEKGAPISAKLVGTPLVGCIMLGAIGSFFWLDLFYGVAITLIVPRTMLN